MGFYIHTTELALRTRRQHLRRAQLALAEARAGNSPDKVAHASEQVLNALTSAWYAQEMVSQFRRRREARIDELMTA